MVPRGGNELTTQNIDNQKQNTKQTKNVLLSVLLKAIKHNFKVQAYYSHLLKMLTGRATLQQ